MIDPLYKEVLLSVGYTVKAFDWDGKVGNFQYPPRQLMGLFKGDTCYVRGDVGDALWGFVPALSTITSKLVEGMTTGIGDSQFVAQPTMHAGRPGWWVGIQALHPESLHWYTMASTNSDGADLHMAIGRLFLEFRKEEPAIKFDIEFP